MLSYAQRAFHAEHRRTLDLLLDDRVVVTREFINPAASRSAIHLLLKRHEPIQLVTGSGVDKRAVGALRAYKPGVIHIDVKYLPRMADESHRRYVFVATDQALRFVYCLHRVPRREVGLGHAQIPARAPPSLPGSDPEGAPRQWQRVH